jgi:hypothetical protein
MGLEEVEGNRGGGGVWGSPKGEMYGTLHTWNNVMYIHMA